MSRPKENRKRRVIHILPETDKKLSREVKKLGTLGKVVDAWADNAPRKISQK